ncbi:hypothetical protein [Polystyrenella longa]|nr:hypothetical protein [Polystyrenella longa]
MNSSYDNIDRSRTSFEGTWILTSTTPAPKQQFMVDFDFALVEITKDAAGNYQGKVAETSNLPEGLEIPELKDLKVEDDTILFALHQGDKILPCEGKLQDGLILGSLFGGNRMILPLRMVATQETSLSTKQEERHRETPDTPEYLKALQSDSPQNALLEFAEKHPENPYSLRAFSTIFSLAPVKDFDRDYLKAAAAKCIEVSSLYGDRMMINSLQSVILNLLETHKHPDLVETYLKKLETEMTDEEREMMSSMLENSNKAINIDRAILALEESSTPENLTQLESLQKESPFEERILLALANEAVKQDQQDQAIQYFGELATIPFLEEKLLRRWKMQQIENPPPSVTFKELWEKKNGDLVGIDEYQDEILKNLVTVHSIEPAEKTEVEGIRRKVLCEFFTSAPCQPCVVPDLALTAADNALDDDEFIMLIYHNHAGGPDPMANPMSMARHESLARITEDKRVASPMVTLNGKLLPLRGGFIDTLPLWEELFMEEVEPLRNHSSRVKINLSAHAKNKQLHVQATTEGLVPPLTKMRLKLALAEEHVDYVSTNGLRSYEMVVRFMPGGPAGIEASNEGFTFDQEIDLEGIKRELLDYIEAFEDQANYRFEEKPLQMKKMYLVGFIQNEETNEILQVEKVPVTGALNYGIMDEITNAPKVEEKETEPAASEEEVKPETKPEAEPAKPEESQSTPEKPEETPAKEKADIPEAVEAKADKPAESPEKPAAEESPAEPEPAAEDPAPETASPETPPEEPLAKEIPAKEAPAESPAP